MWNLRNAGGISVAHAGLHQPERPHDRHAVGEHPGAGDAHPGRLHRRDLGAVPAQRLVAAVAVVSSVVGLVVLVVLVLLLVPSLQRWVQTQVMGS